MFSQISVKPLSSKCKQMFFLIIWGKRTLYSGERIAFFFPPVFDLCLYFAFSTISILAFLS